MGFPKWTLWGMGISAVTALISIGLSLLGQSPQFLRRSGLSGARIDLRVRTFTAIGFALLLLTFGFFVAGVPVGDDSQVMLARSSEETSSQRLTQDSSILSATDVSAELLPIVTALTPATPETGAFDGPPQEATNRGQTPTSESTAPQEPIQNEDDSSATPTFEPTASATPSRSPTPVSSATATPSPTLTATPSLTPTPILSDTTQIATQGSTVWLTRFPGGQNITLLHDGDMVLILSGRANRGGILWREVRTLQGISGWLPEEFLLLDQVENTPSS